MTSKKKKKKSNKWIIVGLIAIVGALLAMAYFRGQSKPKGIEVEVEKVEKRTIKETVSASGKIYPETEVKISSDVSGEIVELFVEEGDSVKAGQLLAKIDPEAFFSAVERGEATLNSSKAQLANSQANVENSKAQREQILVQLENARVIQKRNDELFKDGVISQADYDQSKTNMRQLEANLRSAEASIKSAEKSADGARFQVKSTEASLKELKTNLSRTSIKAPTSGIVSSLSVEQGERVVGTIQMTGTEMMRVANLNSMEVQVDVSENDILRVSEGDVVDIEVDAYLDKTFKGVVTEIANSASNIATAALNTDQVTNFIVKVRIDADSYQGMLKDGKKFPFRPGMSASVDIYTNQSDGSLSIPIQAVTVREREDDEDEEVSSKKNEEEILDEVVFVKSGDTTQMVIVTTDIQDDEYIVVTSGLNEGDEVIIGPYSAVSKKLEDGKRVRIKEKKKDDKKDKD